MDIADKASDRETEFTEQAIAAARSGAGSDKEGPAFCIKCDELNDRAKAGFAVCSDCMGKHGRRSPVDSY